MLSQYQLTELARKIPAHRQKNDGSSDRRSSVDELKSKSQKTQLTSDSFGTVNSHSSKASWDGSLSIAGSGFGSGFSSAYGTLSDAGDLRNSKRTSLIRRPENKESQATGITRVEHWNAPIDGEDLPAALAGRLAGLRTPDVQLRTPDGSSAAPLDYFAHKPVQGSRHHYVASPMPETPRPIAEKSELDLLPKPVETLRRKKKGGRAPIPAEMKMPPTPADSKATTPIPIPKPFETTRRRHKPRPLNAEKGETYRRSNVTRKPEDSEGPEETNLPQPFSSSRWSNMVIQKARHLRRTSTSKPDSQGLFYFVPEPAKPLKGLSSKAQIPGRWIAPDDQVSHWQEPIDSAPPSPSEGPSPSSSICPSLTTSPTNSVASINSVPIRKRGIEGRRESFDEGFGTFIGEIQRSKIEKKRNRALATRDDEDEQTEKEDPERGRNMRRRGREETIKATQDEDSTPGTSPEEDFTIYHSPTRADIRRPKDLDFESPEARAKFSILLPPVKTAKIQPQSPPAAVPPATLARTAAPSVLRLPDFNVLSSQHGQITPSPGITVASLPPRRNTVTPATSSDAEAEADEAFVANVYRYLSLNVPSIARLYDQELSDYAGVDLEAVRKDRKKVLMTYVRRWLRENPDFKGGERMKGGLW